MKLSLNVAKTSFMIVSDNAVPVNFCIKIRNSDISRVNEAKFLGVMLDSKLTFKPHIDLLCKKVSRSVGVMGRLSSLVPPSTLLNIYYSLVHSHLSYCESAWDASAGIHINRLISLQARALRLLPRSDEYQSSFKFHRVLDLTNLYKYSCAVKIFKCFVLGQHSHFYNNFISLIPSHDYETRHRVAGQLNIPFCVKRTSQRSFIYNASKLWNLVPDSIKESSSVVKFKYVYKNHLIETV